MYTSNSLKAELHDRGWRLTPQRETILHVFQDLQKGKHLSAEELHDLLQEQHNPISLSTIYRTVKLMARMGILRELEFAEGHKHYELNQPYPYHHHHLICVKCNKTIEFKSEPVLKNWRQDRRERGVSPIRLSAFHSCHLSPVPKIPYSPIREDSV